MRVDNPWSSPPANQLELIRGYEQEIQDAFATGKYEPVVWPYRSWGFLIVIIYLLLPPTRSKLVTYAKYPVFMYFVYWSLKCMRETRSIHMHVNYAIGLVNCWSVIWLAAITIFNDMRGIAERIERRTEESPKDSGQNARTSEAKTAATTAMQAGQLELRARALECSNPPSITGRLHSKDYTYYWQPLPANLVHRFLWIYDLSTAFRGAGWKHQISSLRPPPPHVLSSLQTPPKAFSFTSPYARHDAPTPSRSSLLLHNIFIFIIGYLIIDWWKTFALRDPYFWGYLNSPPPLFLPQFVRDSAILTHSWRLVTSLLGVYTALNYVGTLNALVYVGLVPERLLAAQVETWMYPDFFGPIRMLWEEGLAGWWGRWWHQLFRIGFTAGTKAILNGLGWEGQSAKGKILGSAMAFGLSGALHGIASWTSWPRSNPWDPVAFFLLQAVGVGLETAAKGWLRRTGISQRCPYWLAKPLTLSWVTIYMYLTAGLLASDFARSGIWLFEPLPISIFRGLGYGLPEEGWWCWRGVMVWWHTDEVWYKSGIAM